MPRDGVAMIIIGTDKYGREIGGEYRDGLVRYRFSHNACGLGLELGFELGWPVERVIDSFNAHQPEGWEQYLAAEESLNGN